MSELISNIELKKADGAPIKFNFQFENGLPIKPIIEVPYKIWMSKKTEELGVTIKINQSILKNDFTLNNISYHHTNDYTKDIWIHLPNCYLVLKNIKNTIIEKMNINGLIVEFLNESN